MSTPYERKTSFRANLLNTFRNVDPEGLDALLESDNPFGHFNFRCHRNLTLTQAIAEITAYNDSYYSVIFNMYKKLINHGLSSAEKIHMVRIIVHVMHYDNVPIAELTPMFGKRFLEHHYQLRHGYGII